MKYMNWYIAKIIGAVVEIENNKIVFTDLKTAEKRLDEWIKN
jgi:hypothetical protein